MKTLFIPLVFGGVLIWSACSSNTNENDGGKSPQSMVQEEQTPKSTDEKGIGKITSVTLTNPLNQEWVKSGEGIYNMKCLSCHKLTDEKVVGPGWKGVTTRRKPEWIMNFITNTDEMIDKDPNAQKMLEQCLTRMPNQNLSEQDARNVLEFMRSNDGVK